MKRVGFWYHGWNVVAMSITTQTASLVLALNCLSMFMPIWSEEFAVPVSTLALGVVLFSIATAVSCYWVGIFSSRYSPRIVFGAGLTLLAIIHFLVAVSHHVWQILAIYGAIMPLAAGLCGSIPSQELVSRWFVRRVGLAMGLSAAGLAVPGLVFTPIVIGLLRLYNWRVIWAGGGCIILFLVLPIALAVFRDRRASDDTFGYLKSAHREPDIRAALPFREIIARRNFWVIFGGFLCVQFIPMTMFVNVTPIIRSYGGSIELAGAFLMVFSVSAMVAKLISGWLVDRIGNRLLFVLAAAGSGLGALLFAMPSTDTIYLVCASIALGLSGATWTLLASSILAEFGPATFGRAFGLASIAGPFATFAAPIVAKSQELTGSYAGPLTALGLLSLAASLSLLFLFQPQFISAKLQPA